MALFSDIAFSKYAIYLCITLGILLFLLLRWVSILLSKFIKNKTRNSKFHARWPFIEVMIWIVFIVGCIEFLYGNNVFYSMVGIFFLTLLVGVLLWYSLRDYLAGVAFRINRVVQLNEVVSVLTYTGVVRKFRARYLELEQKNGEVVLIPYAKLYGNSISKVNIAEQLKAHTFSLRVANDRDFVTLKHEITVEILNMASASLRNDPAIYLTGEEHGVLILEVIIYAAQRKYFPAMQQQIEHKFALKS